MDSKLIIGALSGWCDKLQIGTSDQYQHRRELCRNTWMKDAAELGIPVMFLMGTPPYGLTYSIGEDMLMLQAPNHYDSLPQRTRRWIQAMLKRSDWTHLFKCDDDTFVSIPRLLGLLQELPEPTDYVGAEWKPGVNYGSGGAGYLISRRAAEVVARELTAETGPEDLLVGRILTCEGFPLRLEPRLIPFGNPLKRPMRVNQLVTAHAFSSVDWIDSWNQTGLHPRKTTTSGE